MDDPALQDRFTWVGPIRTRYQQAGDSGSVVVLLHGIGCSVAEWSANIRALAAHHRVYALDLLGYGLTDKPADEPGDIRRLAQFTLDFLTAQGIDRAHLAGNSMGGRIAIECALIAPRRVSSMLLAAPAGIGRDTLLNFRIASVPLLGELLTRPNRAGLRMLWRTAFQDPAFVTAQMVDEKYRLAKLPGAQSFFLRSLRSMVSLGGFPVDQVASLHAALPTIATRSLIIWGRQDRLLPVAQAQVLKRLLPQSRLEIFDPCGHVPQIECAARFDQLALEFMAQTDAQDSLS